MFEGVAMRFVELSDEQWVFIKPHLPPQPIVGRKRANDRNTINGILYVLITGCRWHDMPRCYGAYQTAWRRLKWWSKDGVWVKILAAAQEKSYAMGKLSLDTLAVDSTLIDSKKVANPQSTMATKDARA
jgi:transposase